MHPEFQQLMSQATQLTRAGDLTAATALIQAALSGVQPSAASTPRSPSGAFSPPPPFSSEAFTASTPFSASGAFAASAPFSASGAFSAAPPFSSSEAYPSFGARRYDEADVIDVDAWEVPSAAPVHARAADAGDTFMAGTFRNAAGQRGYKLYVPPLPAGSADTARPLVVMLHGCTQDADDFAAGTAMNDAAREQGFYVLYPVQPRETNPQKCWNWFKHNHQQAGRGEPSILADMTRDVIAAHGIDTRRVYVAGLSAGGAMAAILASVYPELYAAAGVHSGLAAGAATDLPSALSAMKGVGIRSASASHDAAPTIVFHGDRDTTVHPANADAVIAASAGARANVESVRVSGVNQGRDSTKRVYRNPAGEVVAEYWVVHGAGHAWSGGSERGSYTDRTGPNATREMLRFFFEHPLAAKH